MATIDYKEKYEQALEKAKEIFKDYESRNLNDIAIYAKEDLTIIFPELRESEDERIRKALMQNLKERFGTKGNMGEGLDMPDVLAWLEKQSEEPNYCHHEVDLSECSEEYRKAYYDGWNNCNMQHSQCKSELDDVVKCLINGMKFYYENNEEATWGTDKWSMPVKHIIEVLEKQNEQILANSAKTCKDEQKPVFEMKTPEESLGIDSDTYNKIVDECIYGEQKPSWSEEDEVALGDALWCCEQAASIAKDENDMGNAWYAEHWLKSLKDRVQPKQEWSEEDESHIRYLIECLENCKKGVALTMTTSTAQEYINWLKSLRPNHWKPSKEQMKALDKAIYDVDDSIATQLAMLIGDLRKLKGE